MRTIFERLKTISNEYRNTVDDLSENYELDGRRDFQFNDEIKSQRLQERNAKFNRLIDDAARKAVEAAAPLIAELREKLKGYITSSDDADMLTTVQALIAGNVTLTDAELAAFSGKGGYATLKLLEKYTHGRVTAPKMNALEADLKELEVFFKDIGCYRAGMAAISQSRPWGQHAVVGNAVVKGQLDHFPDKLTEIQTRWASLLG